MATRSFAKPATGLPLQALDNGNIHPARGFWSTTAKPLGLDCHVQHIFPGSDETIFTASRNIPETNHALDRLNSDEEIGMNMIVANVLMREAAKAQTEARSFKILAFFCGFGLLASLCLASFGLDVSGGDF